MRRGDLVTVSLPGDYGKPRPALVVQSDLFAAHPSVTLLPVTSALIDGVPLLRPTLTPDAGNGLVRPSQIMVDKISTIARDKVGEPFGRLSETAMAEVTRLLAVFLGLG